MFIWAQTSYWKQAETFDLTDIFYDEFLRNIHINRTRTLPLRGSQSVMGDIKSKVNVTREKQG